MWGSWRKVALRLKLISAEQGEAVGVLEGAYIMHEEYSPYKPLMVDPHAASE